MSAQADRVRARPFKMRRVARWDVRGAPLRVGTFIPVPSPNGKGDAQLLLGAVDSGRPRRVK